MPTLFQILESPGLFVDAALTDESCSLLFLSVWGRDTAAQEFIARLSLKPSDGGLDSFRIKPVSGDGRARLINTGNVERLEKLTGRTAQTLFGSLTQMWLFDPLCRQPDLSNRRALVLARTGEAPAVMEDRVWRVVRDTCHLPLLSHWRPTILTVCHDQEWTKPLPGHGLDAVWIELSPEAIEPVITGLIRHQALTLD
jgi:hypothetical protein